jgi:hypothetical protein
MVTHLLVTVLNENGEQAGWQYAERTSRLQQSTLDEATNMLFTVERMVGGRHTIRHSKWRDGEGYSGL